MALCTDRTVVNANPNEGRAHALKCKRWSCETCNPDCRRKVIGCAKEGHPNVFMTLTCVHGKYETPDAAARDMKRGLVLLRRKLERAHGIKKLPFIVVFEKHKDGFPHMHLLCRMPYVHWTKLRKYWEEITGAYQVDVRFIRKKTQVLFYVTKYIGKDLAAFQGCKRWWRSHNYSEGKEEREPLFLFGDRLIIENLSFFDFRRTKDTRFYEVREDGKYAISWRRKGAFAYSDRVFGSSASRTLP